MEWASDAKAGTSSGPDRSLQVHIARNLPNDVHATMRVYMAHTTTRHTVSIGLLEGEPIRMEGLRGVFEQVPMDGQVQLVPVIGPLQELLANPEVGYIIVDMNSSPGHLETLQQINRMKPSVRSIVIGPELEDAQVMEAIIAGARAYLDMTAGPRTIREAIEIVLSGSIWAPRRSLARLIDRLLAQKESSAFANATNLTTREKQVLDLILLARSNREIAEELGIEERTVKSHVGKLMRKTGAENRIGLSMQALTGTVTSRQGLSGPAKT